MPSSDQKKKWAKTHRITQSEDPREVGLYGKDWAEANVEQGWFDSLSPWERVRVMPKGSQKPSFYLRLFRSFAPHPSLSQRLRRSRAQFTLHGFTNCFPIRILAGQISHCRLHHSAHILH